MEIQDTACRGRSRNLGGGGGGGTYQCCLNFFKMFDCNIQSILAPKKSKTEADILAISHTLLWTQLQIFKAYFAPSFY